MASTRSTIDLIIRGSLSGLTGAVGTASAELEALRQRADDLAPVGERAGRALTLLGKAMLGITAITSAGQVIGGVVIALQNLLPIALLAPAAIAGLGVVFATVKLGLKGFGDAVKKGGDDLAKLSPNARLAAQALRDMAPAAHAVQQVVQDFLFKGLGVEIKALGDTYLPKLKFGLGQIAVPLNGVALGFIRVAKSSDSVKAVNTILGGTATALKGIEPAAGAVLAGFLTLASAGIKSFAGLGKGISDVAIKFRDWAKDLVVSGRFDVLVSRAKEAFGQIGRIIGNVGAVIRSAFEGLSSGGGSPLAALEALTARLREFFATAAAQDALKSLGQAFRDIADVTRTVLLEALKQLAPIIRDLAPFVAECARAFGTLLVNALKIVGPILQSVAKFLGDHKELAQVLIPLIAGLALKFGLLKVGTAVINGILGLKNALGGLRGLGLAALAVGLAAVAVELDKLNVAAAPKGDTEQSGGLADTLHNIVLAGQQLLSGDFSGILSKIKDEANQTAEAWRKNETGLIRFIKKLEEFGTFVNGSLKGSFDALSGFGDQVNIALTNAGAAMSAFGTNINNALTNAGSGLSAFGTNVNTAIGGAIGALSNFGLQVNTIIAGAIGTLTNFGTQVNGIIAGAIAAFSNFGVQVNAGIANVLGVIGAFPAQAGAALASFVGVLVGVATQGMNGFRGAIVDGANAVVGFVRGIPGMISSALGNLGGVLVGAGRALMDGLGAGIRAGLQSVLDFARTIASQIAAVKGPIPKDRKTLVPAGLALMSGLLDGLKTGNKDVQAFVGTIADQIAQSAASGGLIATAAGLTDGSRAGSTAGITNTSTPLAVTIPIHIGDEVVRVVHTEIDTSNRNTKRVVRAGAGVTAG